MISLEDIDGKKYGTGNTITADSYLDIKVQPTNACIKFIKAFINQVGNNHRSYKSEDINLQKIIDEYLLNIEKQQEKNLNTVNDTFANLGQSPQGMDSIPGFENNEINLQDLLGQAFDGGVNIDLNLFDNELGQVQQELEKVAEGLCRGFSFGGANACEGLPVPFNQAFLAPGDYHILGCIKLPLVPLNKGLPVFHFPGTLTTPV
jgi:hypothetical protein